MTALLPGDAESNVLSRLPLQRVDLLKVSHHGSEDAGLEGLLARLRPRVAVISAGARNRFGHPRSETLESLNAAGVSVYRTDRVGSTTVAAGPGGTEITTERAP
jgi:competence protein ComEC